MQIVIDIPEVDFDRLKKRIEFAPLDATYYEIAIANGTPLPEHHGRLIDADAIEQEMIIAEDTAHCDYYMADVIDRAKEYIIDAETIIPATKEEKPTERNCETCNHSRDNHINDTETCHLCMWKNQYEPKQIATKEGDGE